MKTLIAMAALAIVTQAHAVVTKVAPSADTVKPSVVEHVFIVQAETDTLPAVRLIQTDNGGSTDISSVVAPSRLYVTFHKDGEMYDVDGNYLALPSVQDLKVVKFDSKKGEVTIAFITKDETLKSFNHTAVLFIADALKEIPKANSPDESAYSLKSTIGLQDVTH